MASRGLNRVTLIGNLGKDPEIKYFPNGDAFCNVTIATGETWKDKNSGEQKERTEWHNVVFSKKLAEIVGQYLKKGSKVYVEGSLRTRKWEKDGIDRYTTEIIVQDMQMLDSRPSGSDSADGGGRSRTQSQPQQSDAGMADHSFAGDDDIPFNDPYRRRALRWA